jgi:hypothetical protein
MMNKSLSLLFFTWSVLACNPSQTEVVLPVHNVLLPLEAPLTPRPTQSRTIRTIELPPGELKSVRLKKAEIGAPELPGLQFARAIRLSLIDPQGNILLIASLESIPENQPLLQLIPLPNAVFRSAFHQNQLDILLEVDNIIRSDTGIMLIGSLDFELIY